MRKFLCVPMIALCLMLCGCGAGADGGETAAADLRDRYHDMAGCTMEAVVACDQEGLAWEATLKCEYVPGGESTVEVLAPEAVAGVRAVLSDTDWYLSYGNETLNVGALSREEISPASCLPRLMSALRDGWLLEESEEAWNDTPCLRITVDQTGAQEGRIVSTVWLEQEGGTPVRGEIAVDGETILTADFTSFAFCDTLEEKP